jgi:hypothetical protein
MVFNAIKKLNFEVSKWNILEFIQGTEGSDN